MPFDFIDVYSTMVIALLLRYYCRKKGPPELILPAARFGCRLVQAT
jgi:hypothetical protein